MVATNVTIRLEVAGLPCCLFKVRSLFLCLMLSSVVTQSITKYSGAVK